MIDTYTYNRYLQQSKTLGGTTSRKQDHVHLSFGFPYSDKFPVQQLAAAAQKATFEQGAQALHYFGGSAVQFLPQWVKGRLARIGIEAPAENIRILAGAVQAIEIAARILINAGDEVWVEDPSFFGAIRIFKLAGAAIRAFEMDRDGLLIEPLRAELEQRRAAGQPMPKFIYVMPNYQNPTGISLSVDRRKALAELAKTYGFYILEDDAYLELNFTGVWRPAIRSFAPDHVIHIGTFSKIIGPGVRLGWAVAPQHLQRYIQQFMGGSETNPYTSQIVAQYLQDNDFEAYLDELLDCYRSHLAGMLEALEREFGNEIIVNKPEGGFFLTIRFSQPIDVVKLSAEAEEQGVSVLNGSAFFMDKEGRDMLRLCYTYCSPEQIGKGIIRLRKAYDIVRKQNG
ncbi:PLP-dependent aminotransferase family protein [Paenibacillus thalictri]|uniref:PLP-dependent aminotransferase family protein n=1 Tax=Paenibacillus thalictri TaxID=2527873 RepID=A0A4Q9DI87_9BACL|nr:PLP-dependent aminotransferase family protein [Paenibacillus thalictri]TBL70913.1 PLP-dependent aminotransferase family protein [Paenibacillus thalictri]